MGFLGVPLVFLGIPLVNGGSDRGFDGFMGVYGGLWGFMGVYGGLWGFIGVYRGLWGFMGVLVDFLGVPLVNGGSDRGFDGFMGVG